MSRRELRIERVEYPPPPPSKCAKFLYYTWKLCSVVFSHFVMISLVVAYCILGAVTFERLESQHEKEVKMNISQIRSNTTHSIWRMTNSVTYLNQLNWTSDVVDMLKDFENAILLEMKVRGWDGNESTDHIQWTFTGALFYSIIVITTIGYGHIAPKTHSGKVATIFYAILGIPLMLLCLSNIGDVMASSFRFLYWRVCCYIIEGFCEE
ncbi:potassium channel subfamily K member 9-like [Leptidea sinapis]|uniref:potassium channel subfamily K member 9-like n=1 Tax=Leptidea sinapis TaxID=189913 RepID=UPI0021C311DF|nr:potassium channel subfamily K member 9-like [Leptidea sinapis]